MPAFSRFTRYFLEAARQGSLRKAAEALHVSASAIDRQILQAEAELEIPLFERLPSGLKLTAAGELLFHDLRRWQKDFIRTTERLDELRGLKRGQVNIALIDALSEGFVPAIIAAIGAELPRLRFELSVLKSGQVVEAVQALEADFGLLLEPSEEAGLTIHARAEVPIGVVVPAGHPWVGAGPVRLSALQGERLVLAAAPLMISARVAALAARQDLRSEPVVSCNDVRMMRALIRAGAGIGILSLLDAAPGIDDHGLVFLPLEGRHVKPLTLALCVAPRRQLSRAAQLVMQRVAMAMEHAAQGWEAAGQGR